jgi:hypothetical protein
VKRRIILVVWLLVAGAIVNIAVAWGVAGRTTLFNKPMHVMGRPESRSLFICRLGEEKLNVVGMRRNTVGATLTVISFSSPDEKKSADGYFFDWRYGCPIRSLVTEDAPSGAGQPRLLSLRPIWPGFAINTFFYAGILWLLLTAPFALRRRRRIKRGLCPACAYPIGASSVCTECGQTLSGKS